MNTKINFIEKSKADLTARELYKLTSTPEAMKMSDAVGSIIDVDMWAVFEKEDQEGHVNTLLSLVTPEGETYTTNSSTFRNEFLNIVAIVEEAGEVLDKIKVVGGTSKNGRDYIIAVMV